MSGSVPGSREALFALLRELARAEHAAPDRLAEVRQAIQHGHLGPVSEAFVEGRDGRPAPLLAWAASWNDAELVSLLLASGADLEAGGDRTALHAAVSAGHLALVELLLARGATPLAPGRARESVLRAAHRHGPGPIAQLVRRAAREASERSGRAPHGLATSTSERPYALWTARGVEDLRRATAASRELDVLLVGCELKAVARALGNLVQAPRREADVARRPVADAARLVFLYRLRGIGWTIVPFVFEPASPWNVEQVTEHAAPATAGAGIAPMARALASATGSRVIHVQHDQHTIYTEHGGIERGRSEETSDELAELGAFVPPMRVSTDGYHVQLELLGLEPSDVERVDVVVLQELGEPRVERAIALATTAPAIVGAPVLLAPGLPALVQPPAVVAPAGSEPPPLLREPPPIVTDAGPARSEAPPLLREPPPMVAVTTPSEPSVESEPSAERVPVESGPPAVAEATRSAPPPLVREPPRMVVVATDLDGSSSSDPDVLASDET